MRHTSEISSNQLEVFFKLSEQADSAFSLLQKYNEALIKRGRRKDRELQKQLKPSLSLPVKDKSFVHQFTVEEYNRSMLFLESQLTEIKSKLPMITRYYRAIKED